MKFLEKINKNILSKDSNLDNWVNKNITAYGWRGFFASSFYLGIGYILFYFSIDIIEYFGGAINDNDVLNHNTQVVIVSKIFTILFIFNLLKLLRDFSKKGRATHKKN